MCTSVPSVKWRDMVARRAVNIGTIPGYPLALTSDNTWKKQVIDQADFTFWLQIYKKKNFKGFGLVLPPSPGVTAALTPYWNY